MEIETVPCSGRKHQTSDKFWRRVAGVSHKRGGDRYIVTAGRSLIVCRGARAVRFGKTTGEQYTYVYTCTVVTVLVGCVEKMATLTYSEKDNYS